MIVRIFYTFYLLLLCLGVSAQVVYKTVKTDGSVVYSDVRSDGAVAVNLSSMNTVVVPALNNATSQKIGRINPAKKLRPEVQYIVSIRSPDAEQTLRDNSGAVMIDAEVLPKRSGKYQLIIDNQVVKTQSNRKFQLENINRGAHTIQVNFLDNSGKILASSKPQTFYLQKASALINVN
ncbi:MAG: TolA-binding protein [Gammaproteobacteria bacterium]